MVTILVLACRQHASPMVMPTIPDVPAPCGYLRAGTSKYVLRFLFSLLQLVSDDTEASFANGGDADGGAQPTFPGHHPSTSVSTMNLIYGNDNHSRCPRAVWIPACQH